MKYHHMCLPLQIAPTDQCYKVSIFIFSIDLSIVFFANPIQNFNIWKKFNTEWNPCSGTPTSSLQCFEMWAVRHWRWYVVVIVIVIRLSSLRFKYSAGSCVWAALWLYGIACISDSSYNVQLTIIKIFCSWIGMPI